MDEIDDNEKEIVMHEVGTIRIDFSKVPSNFIPAGEYEAVISKVEVRESKSGPWPYLNWEFDITEEEHAGRKVWMMTSLSPKALWGVQGAFSTLGIVSDSDALTELEYDPDDGTLTNPDFAGMSVIVAVEEDEWQGQKHSRAVAITYCEHPFGDEDAEVASDLGEGENVPLQEDLL